MQHRCAWCPQRSEGVTPELELQTIGSRHIGVIFMRTCSGLKFCLCVYVFVHARAQGGYSREATAHM